MIKYCMLLALATLMVACNKPQESLSARLQKSDRVEIEFYGEAHATTNPVVLLDRADIDGMSTMVTETKTEALKCAYDGKITFKKADSLVFAGEFNLAADCGHIAYDDAGKTEFRKISSGAMGKLTTLKAANTASKLDGLLWFLGRWTQVEGPDLVSYEDWKRESPSLYKGLSWTLYQNDTVHVETIDLTLEGEDIYYIPTVAENKGPVRFKMTSLVGKSVLFENPEHDFPQKITYEAQGDSVLLAKISGAKAGGKEIIKEFPLHRVVR
jgi:hypothetical protein